MPLKNYLLSVSIFFVFVGWCCPTLTAQHGKNEHIPANHLRKSFSAARTSNPPKIDGVLFDTVWAKAEPATGFFQYEPHNDRAASFETQVRVLYDDKAIYISAMLSDPSPDSILTELGLRDSGDQLNADRFWVDINPFNDGINGFRFQVSASGVQTDINMSGTGSSGGYSRGDRNWDAVWISAVSLKDNGWAVEMEIPYAALRFPREDVHEWGINFWREIRRTRETSSWNFVNRRIGDPLASMGVMNGLYGIKPPLRLAFFPYVSGYMEKNGGEQGWANTFNGGMDVKLGISPAFTMDMTLVPDFGQVQSDALVLNLTPYEVKYDENRQFFTEGTELFSKADLFYSRRIGTRPRNYAKARKELQEQEIVLDNPLETRMINATKLSGRTRSGLGIGIFNAMTEHSEAILKDTITGNTREIITQPFTNYNLLVVDQSLKNHSSISLVNTNVAGSEEGYTANVTGTEFRLLNHSNMYRISGAAAISQQYYRNDNNQFGHKYTLNAGKVGGTWQYNYTRSAVSDTYDQNDMGFLRRNNHLINEGSLSHNIFTPFWRIWNMANSINIEYTQLYEPKTFTDFVLGFSHRTMFDTRLFIMTRANYHPVGQRDYFEPRTPGRFYETDETYNVYLSYSTDYRKRVYVDGSLFYERMFSEYDQDGFSIDFRPTFRVSDQFNLSAGLNYTEKNNDIGYVKQVRADSVFFGMRQSPTLINTLRSTYIFTNTLSLDFVLRHYWSRAIYSGDYFFLNYNGRLSPTDYIPDISDINYNAFTIDMKLTWNFAPGSQLTAVWKNTIDSNQYTLPTSYADNLNQALQQPQINSFSIKILYYLDYQLFQRIS